VKGSIEIMQGKYDDAVKSLSNGMDNADVLFDKGLAQVLAKDYQNALITFNELAEKDADYAMAYYGAAIANARLGSAEASIGAISDAIEADPKLKSKAAADLEFDKMAADSRFIDAVK
jgi:tetratricopeptide (TPR) repeat protein